MGHALITSCQHVADVKSSQKLYASSTEHSELYSVYVQYPVLESGDRHLVFATPARSCEVQANFPCLCLERPSYCNIVSTCLLFNF
jgi:hypothetical protein